MEDQTCKLIMHFLLQIFLSPTLSCKNGYFFYSEYQIGVDVHRGRFQYQQTRVVTLVAHYQLENRTQYKLAYLQRHQLQNQVSL